MSLDFGEHKRTFTKYMRIERTLFKQKEFCGIYDRAYNIAVKIIIMLSNKYFSVYYIYPMELLTIAHDI